jgi:hypothetical protein
MNMNSVFSPRVLAATLLLASTASLAQSSPPPVLRWAEGAPNATSEVKNDMKVEGLKTDDVHIYVGIADLKDTQYNRVWVSISNHGKSPIDFNPQSSVLLKGDKGIRAEETDKAAKSIQKYGEAKSQELSNAKCPNMIATQCAPNNSQISSAKQIAANTASQGEWLRGNAIKQQTLAPGAEASGYIAFKKDKKAAQYILRVPVGSATFEFPLSAENKPPAWDNL